MPDRSAPALLTVFAAGTVGMVEAVAWLGRRPRPRPREPREPRAGRRHRDGVAACRYLARRSRAEFERSSGQSCATFFGGRTVRVGGEAIDSQAQLAAARSTVATAGADRLVTMSYAGRRIRFRLAPASAVERREYLAPATPWRIASDVTGVV